MGPKATARAARWADGVYVWSGNGVKSEIAQLLAQTDRAWEAAKRDDAAAPHRRLLVLARGEGSAREAPVATCTTTSRTSARRRRARMASMMNRATPDAVRQSLDDLEAAGCDEVFLVPATAELAEVERAAEIVSRR